MVTLVEAGGNLGYSGGINLGRQHVPPTHQLAVLNPDLRVAEDCLSRLTEVLTDPTIGIAVPMLLNTDGSRFDSLRREPSVLRVFGDSVFGSRWPNRPKFLAETLRRDDEYSRAGDVAWAGGAALLISSVCNEEVGPWDADTYFLYSEETDYASRARESGFRVRYEPTAQAWHIGSASGQPAELVALMSVNRIRYFANRHGRLPSLLFGVAVAVQHLIRVRDPRHRIALRYVVDRSSWSRLPNGDRPSTKGTAG
jgi:GT2 family glycosyltransferase